MYIQTEQSGTQVARWPSKYPSKQNWLWQIHFPSKEYLISFYEKATFSTSSDWLWIWEEGISKEFSNQKKEGTLCSL